MDRVTIRETTLRELVATGSVGTAAAKGHAGGFLVAIRCGPHERVLANARGGIRVFSNLTTLASFLRKLGISRFEVNTDGYVPGRVRKPRPDRVAALRQTRTRPSQAHLFKATP